MARIPECTNCNKQGIRNEQWDTYFCKQCDIWIEEKCSETPLGNSEDGDPLCWFSCWERPDKPSMSEIKL